jgi:DNA-binding transcriptional LysR family regulator
MTTLRTLECLVALVDHGSVSAAAAALHMSQPALSGRSGRATRRQVPI